MTIQEGNILISEFMGYECKGYYGWTDRNLKFYFSHNDYPNETFYSSWDLLIPVLNKIRYTKATQRIHAVDTIGNDNIVRGLLSLDIKKTYKAVVEFIQWHNANK